MKKSLVIFTTFFLFVTSHIFAQCSDAGVCAIGHTPKADKKNVGIEVLYRFGYSGKEDKSSYNSIELKSAIHLFDKTSLLVSLPLYKYNSHEVGSVSGIGDAMVFINRDFGQLLKGNIDATLGVKLATGNSNAAADLPQSLQPGLGSNDLIFGLRWNSESFFISTGYQYAQKVFTKNELTPIKRGDDLYLQLGRNFRFSDFDVKGDIQMIQRLGKTELKRPDNSITLLDKTDQMQINLGGEITYPLSADQYLSAGLAFPLLKRESNVDGLTRGLTIYAGWKTDL